MKSEAGMISPSDIVPAALKQFGKLGWLGWRLVASLNESLFLHRGTKVGENP